MLDFINVLKILVLCDFCFLNMSIYLKFTFVSIAVPCPGRVTGANELLVFVGTFYLKIYVFVNDNNQKPQK